MAELTQLLPMKLFFVAIFGFLPAIITIYERGVDDVSTNEWASFALLGLGAVLVYVVSQATSSVQMQRYLWPLLGVMAVGLLLYRRSMVARGEFDESSIERGGTSYDD